MRVLFLVMAGAAFGHDDGPGTIQSLTAHIKEHPKQGELYLQRALLNTVHQDYTAAHQDLKKASELGADILAVHVARAKLFLALEKFDEARPELDQLLAKEPKHVEALTMRASLCVRDGDHEGAITRFTAAIEASAHPEPELYIERAQLLGQLEPPRHDAAIQGLDQGLKRLGANVVTLVLCAIDCEVNAGKFDSALARIESISANSPRKESWLLRRGEVLLAAEKQTEAGAALRAAIASAEKLPERQRNLPATRALVRKAESHLRLLQTTAR